MDPKAPRSKSTGKTAARPLADGRLAPRNNFRLPSQMPVQLRQKDKLVLLPRSASEKHEADVVSAATAAGGLGGWGDLQQQQRQLSADGDSFSAQQQPASSLFVDLTEVLPDSRGRVTVYCIAESLDRSILEALAASQMPSAVLTSHSEVLHLSLPVPEGSEPADCFFFGELNREKGVRWCEVVVFGVVCWQQEQVVMCARSSCTQVVLATAPRIESCKLCCSLATEAVLTFSNAHCVIVVPWPLVTTTPPPLKLLPHHRLWCGVLLGPHSQAGAGNSQQPGQEGTAAATAAARGGEL